MTDLEQRATEAVIKLRQQWGTQEPSDSDSQLAQAALAALPLTPEQLEGLASGDMVVVPYECPHGCKNTGWIGAANEWDDTAALPCPIHAAHQQEE